MTLPFFVDPVLSSRLCLTLLHSLWQAAVLTGIALALSRLARRRSVEEGLRIPRDGPVDDPRGDARHVRPPG